MKTIVTNEAKTPEQVEAQAIELARQCVINSIADTIDSNVPIDLDSIKKQVAYKIKQILSKNDKLVMSQTTVGEFELSDS